MMINVCELWYLNLFHRTLTLFYLLHYFTDNICTRDSKILLNSKYTATVSCLLVSLLNNIGNYKGWNHLTFHPICISLKPISMQHIPLCTSHCLKNTKLTTHEVSWKLRDLDNAAGLACNAGDVSLILVFFSSLLD